MKSVKLENYKILGITLDTLFRWQSLDLIINLDNIRTNDNEFFTIDSIDSRVNLNETCVTLGLANKFEDIRNQFTDLLIK